MDEAQGAAPTEAVYGRPRMSFSAGSGSFDFYRQDGAILPGARIIKTRDPAFEEFMNQAWQTTVMGINEEICANAGFDVKENKDDGPVYMGGAY